MRTNAQNRFRPWQLLGFLLLACPPSTASAKDLTSPRHGDVGVLPDSWGALDEITVHYDSRFADALDPLYHDVFSEIPNDVRVRVLCPSGQDARKFIESWAPFLRGRDVRLINVGLPLSIWARDRCIPKQPADLATAGGVFVPLPEQEFFDEQRDNDLVVCEWLGRKQPPLGATLGPLRIDGGNVVANRHQVFVGANVLADNAELTGDTLTRSFKELFGRDYLLVGDDIGDVPWCHIDMYLTPISDDTVLVASPRFGLKLMGVGDDDIESADPDLGAACPDDELQHRFDDVATLLVAQGYRVRRLPALVNTTEQWMVTYNNVIIDDRDGFYTVYMPVYGIPVLDEMAIGIYVALGMDVRTVDVSGVYTSGGALRCVVNVTERRPPDVPPRPGRRHMQYVSLPGQRMYDGLPPAWTRCRAHAGQNRSEGASR